MTVKSIAMMTVAAAALIAQPAAAKTEGWYLGLGVGWAKSDPIKFDVAPPVGPVDGNITFGDTASANFAIGYKFDIPIRVEWEIQYADFDAHQLRLLPALATNARGDVGMASYMANVFYDYPLTDHFALTIGGGLGVAQVDSNLSDALGNSITGSDTAFTWQAIGGVTTSLSDRFELGLNYRYQFVDTTGHDFRAGVLAPASLKTKRTQTLMLDLRWYVSEPAAAPAPTPYIPPPPPPPAPPAPAPVKTFIVFFDFDKSNLTSEAVQVVDQAANTAKSAGMVKILITGHTDTVGSADYNQALSERRANSVKAQLVSDGLGDGDIATTGKGFSEPLVNTGPGVREPQNRRAVIDLGNG